MREIEPHVAGIAPVRVPEEGIVDYGGVCTAMQRHIVARGGSVLTGHRVQALQRNGAKWDIQTLSRTLRRKVPHQLRRPALRSHCRHVWCATPTRIVPVRGEYYSLNAEGAKLVRNLIYPVPDPAFPFLGVTTRA